MGFKENLRRKIEIDRLADHVARTVSAGPDSDLRIDKPAMRRLLAMAGWEERRERDLELFLPPGGGSEVLVLDNDLPIYRTTVADVALRKSPTVKEMISIRNVIRILNDAEVVVSKKVETVDAVRRACVAGLDLRYTSADLEALAFDGRAAMENRYPEGVLEILDLFAELLGYRPPPKPFQAPHHHIRGERPAGDGPVRFGPLFLYSRLHHRLQWIDAPVDSGDPDALRRYGRILEGEATADAEGPEVFGRLTERIPAPGTLPV